MQKKNLLFLSYGEDLFQNPILQNQFIQFAENFNTEKYNVHILSFVPLSRKRLFQNKLWNQEKNELQKRLRQKSIHFTVSTLPALASWLYSTFWQFCFFHTPYQHIYLASYIRKNKIDFVSCRSYHATFAALTVRRYLDEGKFKVHFDPRSLFVEEGQYLNRIGFLSFRMWILIERELYKKSDIVSFVNSPFMEIKKNQYKIRNAILLYPHTATKLFQFEKKPTESLVFCYLGQLDNNGWHQIRPLLSLYAELRKYFPKSKLKIITRSPQEPIQQLISQRGLADIEIYQSDSLKKTSDILRECHIGLISYKEKHGQKECEQLLAKIGMGSKVAEYLAAGLPIIYNKNLEAIHYLDPDEKFLVPFSPDNYEELQKKLMDTLSHFVEKSEKCQNTARTFFNVETNVNKIDALL